MICATRDNNAAAHRSRCLAGLSRRRRRLRAGVAMLAVILLAPAAAAADLDDSVLRGSFSDMFSSKSYSRWDGVNLGVHVGASNMNTDFSKTSSKIVSDILRETTLESENHPSEWAVLPNTTTNGRSYGAFLGYNMQWDQLVVGLDAAYNRLSSLETSSGPASLRRITTTSDSTVSDVTITSQAAIKLVDYATMRLRAGYAFGQFLPYATIGAAAGRFNYTNTATVTVIQTPSGGVPGLPYIRTGGDNKDGAITAGFLLGLGMDVALLPNLFLRGEWETVSFTPISGIRVNLNSGRVGLGMKF